MVDVQSRRVYFGAQGYSDYTKHKDPQRQRNYIRRHRSHENWNISGIHTSGFWSRWLLWNKPTLRESISDLERRFDVTVHRK
jgi:hypothetical protein